MSRKLDPEIREKVRQRSNYLCEYCHANERWQCVEFTIDHIDPHAGDELENLALACFHCNRRKSNKTNSIDPTTQEIAKLFDPRSQRWNDHFEWSEDGLLIQAKTSIGGSFSRSPRTKSFKNHTHTRGGHSGSSPPTC